MDPLHNTASAPLDCVASLSREAFLEITRRLHGALPWPDVNEADICAMDACETGLCEPGICDSGGQAKRDLGAIAAVAAMLPANAVEGRLAVQFVLADAWSVDCMRLAFERHRETKVAHNCRAQAASLMREARSSLRFLQKMQAERRKLEADQTEADRAAQLEHAVAATMQEALAPASQAKAKPAPRAGAETGSGSNSETMNRHQRRETEARLRKTARAGGVGIPPAERSHPPRG